MENNGIITEQEQSEIVNEIREARQDDAVDRMRDSTREARHKARQVEALIDIRQALDGIARTLAAYDTDPAPERLGDRVVVCRICQLLVERYRSIAAFVERDPDLLGSKESAGELDRYLRDLSAHCERTNHNPLIAMTEAMLDKAKRG